MSGVNLDCDAIGVLGIFISIETPKYISQIVEDLRVANILVDGSEVVDGRLFEVTLRLQCIREIVMSEMVVRIECDCVAIAANRGLRR